MPSNALTAIYSAPSVKQTLSSSLPSLPAAQDIQQKTTYLSALRSSVTTMQNDINVFLTQKMEEDKASESGKDGVKSTTQDDRAEELYGEEDVEDEG